MKSLVKFVSALALAIPMSLPAAPEVHDEEHYSQSELDRLLAPIALYPDTVLSHILIASTYPLEAAQAARWSLQHPDLSGERAVDAVEDKRWDPSVKALVAFPEILARMDEDLEWTEELGDAFLAQEGDVMDRVQHLRKRAYAAGNLDSLEHVRVIREREVIYIEPALRHIIYLPYYDPWVIYGSWWWPAYPPHRWAYWAGHPVRHYGHGFHWGIGFHVAPVFYFSGFHWHNRHVVVIPVHHAHSHSYWTRSRDVVRHSDARRWQHDSRHRRGVEYRSPRLNSDYARSTPGHDNERRSHSRQRAAVPQDNQQRKAADSRQQYPSRNAGPKDRNAQGESRQGTPRSETRTSKGSGRDDAHGRSSKVESSELRTRERQAQTPERESARAPRSSGDHAESGRNSQRESAPKNERGHRSEGAGAAHNRNNRGETGGRDSRKHSSGR